ncbi:MAG: ADP-ribosylglycohydrolase family protein [Corynebacteriales bacterium]|nr:ADP-ribosylglycohydrolase family protein [Mycobacteriales bacterium]
MHLTTDQRDRAVAALIGSAAGDALGAGYEFTHPADDVVIDMIGGGPFDWAPGEWTDDTSMAMCVAEGLAPGVADLDTIAAAFVRWYDTSPPDIGNQTRSVLSRRSPSAAAMTAAAAAVPGRTGGNGSLMRTAPVALAFLGDPAGCARAAGAISDLTHSDVRAREACQMWSAGIAHGVRTGARDGVRIWLDAAPADVRDHWHPLLDAAQYGTPADFPNNGWVVHALQTAWWAICGADGDVAATLERCVRAGNDTDTTAAIAGGLVGACAGTAGIPEEWTRLLHGYPGLTTTDLVATADRITGADTTPPKETP